MIEWTDENAPDWGRKRTEIGASTGSFIHYVRNAQIFSVPIPAVSR
jgi:hypothetical protein